MRSPAHSRSWLLSTLFQGTDSHRPHRRISLSRVSGPAWCRRVSMCPERSGKNGDFRAAEGYSSARSNSPPTTPNCANCSAACRSGASAVEPRPADAWVRRPPRNNVYLRMCDAHPRRRYAARGEFDLYCAGEGQGRYQAVNGRRLATGSDEGKPPAVQTCHQARNGDCRWQTWSRYAQRHFVSGSPSSWLETGVVHALCGCH